jgi:hypothetical protein
MTQMVEKVAQDAREPRPAAPPGAWCTTVTSGVSLQEPGVETVRRGATNCPNRAADREPRGDLVRQGRGSDATGVPLVEVMLVAQTPSNPEASPGAPSTRPRAPYFATPRTAFDHTAMLPGVPGTDTLK